MFCFIIADKARARRNLVSKKGCRLVRDQELKLEDGKASHTLGGAGVGGT